MDEKELDKFIEEELEKDITQEGSIDPDVEKHLGEMGFLWDAVQTKLIMDNICFGCKIPLFKDTKNKKEGEKLHVIEANKVDTGVIAFVSLCPKCFKKIEKGNKNGNKTKK